MLTYKELRKIEVDLHELGINEFVRKSIRNAKICIIDNQIDDLKSLHDGLRLEGFSNLTKHKTSPSINQLLSSNYDVIILDLNDVATDITEDDGIGVLKLLKESDPSLPVLVVTGQKISPEVQSIISQADLLRKKPVYASDLASDVESILKNTRDKFWAALLVLRELNKIDIELSRDLSLYRRVKLHFARKGLEKKLVKREEDILLRLEHVLRIIRYSTSVTSNISKVATMFLQND